MNEVERLVDQLERAMSGDPWHGDPLLSILERIPPARADAQPPAGVHSIRDIVRHLAAWAGEVRRRLNGLPAGVPSEGDWPPAPGEGPHAWAAEIQSLVTAHDALVQDVRQLTEAHLFEPTRDPRNRVTGAGVTRYELLHGLAQHYAYHAGQIAILAKL